MAFMCSVTPWSEGIAYNKVNQIFILFTFFIITLGGYHSGMIKKIQKSNMGILKSETLAYMDVSLFEMLAWS
jgi:hypothetical protein